MAPLKIRKATPEDAEVIARFNSKMALETENKRLTPEVILSGVQSLFQNPSLGFYIVADIESRVVASLMITTEWSDWRNAMFWWVQSVFVEPESRRKGVYRQMYEFVKALAEDNPAVCGFRLYVEKDNRNAQSTYSALGMEESPYRFFQELKNPGFSDVK